MLAGALLCAGAPEASAQRMIRPKVPQLPVPERIEGELRPGVECPLLIARDGRRFALVGDVSGFAAGQRVSVAVEPLGVSTCMEGLAVRVKRIAAATGAK